MPYVYKLIFQDRGGKETFWKNSSLETPKEVKI